VQNSVAFFPDIKAVTSRRRPDVYRKWIFFVYRPIITIAGCRLSIGEKNSVSYRSVVLFDDVLISHVARIVSWGRGFNVWGADIFRVLLYCYSLLAMSTVSVTEFWSILTS